MMGIAIIVCNKVYIAFVINLCFNCKSMEMVRIVLLLNVAFLYLDDISV